MISDLYDKIYVEINSFASNYRFQFYLSFAVCLLLILLFGILWIYHYMKLAEDASYINAFLLLIPFDVLSENPYIKLYIKNEFDYKTSY
jgi:biotin transporter BioY